MKGSSNEYRSSWSVSRNGQSAENFNEGGKEHMTSGRVTNKTRKIKEILKQKAVVCVLLGGVALSAVTGLVAGGITSAVKNNQIEDMQQEYNEKLEGMEGDYGETIKSLEQDYNDMQSTALGYLKDAGYIIGNQDFGGRNINEDLKNVLETELGGAEFSEWMVKYNPNSGDVMIVMYGYQNGSKLKFAVGVGEIEDLGSFKGETGYETLQNKILEAYGNFDFKSETRKSVPNLRNELNEEWNTRFPTVAQNEGTESVNE